MVGPRRLADGHPSGQAIAWTGACSSGHASAKGRPAMNKSPAAIVKEHFGDKAKLVAALGPLTNDDLWVPRVNEAKGLARVPNAKLLRLFSVLSAVKEKFGNRFKLVDAICEVEKRAGDEGYKKRLLEYPVPRLYDVYRSAANRAGVAVAALPTLSAKA